MGKYDNISKEYLYDLYINKNLSKPEIREITGIPLTSLGRILDKFGIVKSEQLLKEMQSRLVLTTYKNRTEEARLKKIQKLRKKWEDKTPEQKQETIDLFKKINSNRTKSHQEKLVASNKKFYENETDEHKQERIEKARKGTLKWTSEETEEHKRKRYDKARQTVSNWTEEKKKEVSKNHINGFAKRTQEQISDSYKKTIESRKRNGTLFVSKFEKEVKEFVESLGFETTKYVFGYGEERFEIDILIADKNVGIECNGCYYHSQNGVNKYPKSYHFNKKKKSIELGIDLIYVWEDQWLYKQDVIKDILKARLGVYTKERIYARKCSIKEIDSKTYKNFCENNHIQGYRFAQVKLGLFYNEDLVQIASFNKVRNIGKQNAIQEWEWVRGCPASKNVVVGGTSKLFNHFIKSYNPMSVLCYADWNLFNGDGYKQCGFVFSGYTGPDLFYIMNSSMKRISRNPYKHKEYKLLVENGKLFKCYGAGSLRFIWNNDLRTIHS